MGAAASWQPGAAFFSLDRVSPLYYYNQYRGRMLIRVDPQSPQPLFEQISFAVKEAVARGDLAAGDRLPSVRELAQELAINPNTVVRAYELLTRDGVVVRRQGSGCFVSGGGNNLSNRARRRQLDELVQRTVTEAFHLGLGGDDVRESVETALASLRFPDSRDDNRRS
jgi:GntR family transcriptional regulator